MPKIYLIRLDDACPTMDCKKWDTIIRILDANQVKPLIGIVPNNQDPKLEVDPYDETFYDKAKEWVEKGYSVALHGYSHVYGTSDGGMNPIHKRSEFAGVPLEEQNRKIQYGINSLLRKGISPDYFFAPSHTFDQNTIKALNVMSNIRVISDTIACAPYVKGNMLYIPQQFGQFRQVPIHGVWTFCFHPNNMDEEQVVKFERFIKKNAIYFSSFDRVVKEYRHRKIQFQDILLLQSYFLLRRLKTFIVK